MAERGVADFHSGLGDVVLAAEEQLGGAFHANLTQVLRDSHAHFLGEEATEIKGTAADLAAKGLDVRRVSEMAAEDRGGTFDALAGDPFLAMAEEFLLRSRLEKDLGEKLKGLGLVPEFMCTDGNRWLAQGLKGNFLAGGHGTDGSGGATPIDEPAAEGRMKIVFHRVDLHLDVLAGELDGDEGMVLVGIALGLEIGLGIAIEADGMRLVTCLGAVVANSAGPAQVEAKLDAVVMEAAAPINGRGGTKFMVFHADAFAGKGAVKLSPAFLYLRPSAAFVCSSHKSLSIRVWQRRRGSQFEGNEWLNPAQGPARAT